MKKIVRILPKKNNFNYRYSNLEILTINHLDNKSEITWLLLDKQVIIVNVYDCIISKDFIGQKINAQIFLSLETCSIEVDLTSVRIIDGN